MSLAIVLGFFICGADMKEVRTQTGESNFMFTLADSVSSVSTCRSELVPQSRSNRSFMASVTTGSAVVTIQVSNDNSVYKDLLTLSPSAGSPDGYADINSWPYVRANVTAISTGPLTVTMGC